MSFAMTRSKAPSANGSCSAGRDTCRTRQSSQGSNADVGADDGQFRRQSIRNDPVSAPKIKNAASVRRQQVEHISAYFELIRFNGIPIDLVIMSAPLAEPFFYSADHGSSPSSDLRR